MNNKKYLVIGIDNESDFIEQIAKPLYLSKKQAVDLGAKLIKELNENMFDRIVNELGKYDAVLINPLGINDEWMQLLVLEATAKGVDVFDYRMNTNISDVLFSTTVHKERKQTTFKARSNKAIFLLNNVDKEAVGKMIERCKLFCKSNHMVLADTIIQSSEDIDINRINNAIENDNIGYILMNYPTYALIDKIGDIKELAEKKIELLDIIINKSITHTIINEDVALLMVDKSINEMEELPKKYEDLFQRFGKVYGGIPNEIGKRMFKSHKALISTLKAIRTKLPPITVLVDNKDSFAFSEDEWNEVIETLGDEKIKFMTLDGEELKVSINERYIQGMN